MKIPTVALKKQLQNAVFLINKYYLNHFIVHPFRLVSDRSVELILKKTQIRLNYDEFCTNEGTQCMQKELQTLKQVTLCIKIKLQKERF